MWLTYLGKRRRGGHWVDAIDASSLLLLLVDERQFRTCNFPFVQLQLPILIDGT